jgi:hypothetical protein
MEDKWTMLIGPFTAMTASVWLATEFLGKITKKWGFERELLAVVLGVVAGLLAKGQGWIDLGNGPWSWVAAIFLGLIATGLAGVGHDKLVQPVNRSLSKGGS